MSVEGKIVIVTGSSRGIGRAIAKQLLLGGATVIVSSTQDDKAKAVAKELVDENGGEAMGVGVDVSNAESVQAMVKAVLDAYGRVDVLVNNAGITKDNLLLRLSEDDWQDVLDTNLNSVFYATKAVLRPMLKQKGGRLIHIASVVGVIGNPGQSNYAASKGGMIAFSKSIAKEYAAKGIISNVVAPGFIDTDMISTLPKEYLDNIIATIPMKRLGDPEAIGNLVRFLSSDDSQYMTGQVLTIDGGLAT